MSFRHCGSAALRRDDEYRFGVCFMRAEAQALVTEIEESLELLRRRL
jgi:hypothetical protein